MENTKLRLPILALRDLVLFPGVSVPLRVGRSQSMASLEAARMQSPDPSAVRILGVLQKSSVHQDRVNIDELYDVGVILSLDKLRGSETDGYQLIARAGERVKIDEVTEEGGALWASGHLLQDEVDRTPEGEARLKSLLDTLKITGRSIAELLPQGTEQLQNLIDSIESLDLLIYVAAANLEISVESKQSLLSEPSLEKRGLTLLEILQKVKAELEVRSEIRDKMTTKIGKTQREAILREQMRAIKEELGEMGEDASRADDYRKRIDAAKMPDSVQKIALDEVKRLEMLNPQSPELHVIRNYLDLLCALPWQVETPPEVDLKKVEESLNADHYGLDKVKKRILEFIATMKLRSDHRGLILLLVGPPGVGKTSLGASVAKALDRKFVRAALGGVRDDAEIRGHRRTYVGALPGRIIQGIKRAGTLSPVFLLDEIDKLSRGFSGDPTAALLEVLDPEQNSTFNDHYLDVPYDLSKVLFVATANSTEGIPTPLLDRMEVIDIAGYTTSEKVHIALQHLVPKQMEEHGITPSRLVIPKEVIESVTVGYTREAGVRSLQRQIAALCRGKTIELAEEPTDAPAKILSISDVQSILGPPKFEPEEAALKSPAGVVTGLAWTPVGGEILFIEAAAMSGTGKLSLTGQLGDVMKESAQIALTLIRSRLPQVAERVSFDKIDLHVHVPSGAIPKDGPSAGVAMLVSMASLFLQRPVDSKVAMTGEITLRGKVTPVGGIKEKVLAAHRAGIRKVLLARKNERDLREIPNEVRSDLEIRLVDDIGEVLRETVGIELSGQDPVSGLWGSFPTGILKSGGSSSSGDSAPPVL